MRNPPSGPCSWRVGGPPPMGGRCPALAARGACRRSARAASGTQPSAGSDAPCSSTAIISLGTSRVLASVAGGSRRSRPTRADRVPADRLHERRRHRCGGCLCRAGCGSLRMHGRGRRRIRRPPVSPPSACDPMRTPKVTGIREPHPASSSLKAGSSRIGSRSESPSRNERDCSESSIARRRCAMASSFWPARLSQQATL